MLLLFGGCQEPAPLSDVEVRVLGNRSDPTYEWVFAFYGDEVVAQRHIFPGYTQTIIFSYSATSPAIPDKFVVGPGNVEPPFVPGGPWFYRVDIPGDASAEIRTVYFGNDTRELGQAFSDLETVIQSKGKRLDVLPDWVAESSRIRSYFGYE